MLRISWTRKNDKKSILDELPTKRKVLAHIIKIKMAFFGHAGINNNSKLIQSSKAMPSRNDGGEHMKGQVSIFTRTLYSVQ